YPMSGRVVTIQGFNGAAVGPSDDKGKFVATLNPGKYTVTVPLAMPEGERVEKGAEVDLIGGDQAVTMVIPVQIELTITPRPTLLGQDGKAEKFLKELGLTDAEINSLKADLAGYMFYWPPEPVTHIYTIKATANGKPVKGFDLLVTDDVSQLTADAPTAQDPITSDDNGEVKYTITAGLPRLDTTPLPPLPPLAAPKWVKFQATKLGYKDSIPYQENVTVLGDVPVGTATNLVSIPVVNQLVLHDPPGDGSYAYLDDSVTMKGMLTGMKIRMNDKEIPVYPSPWTLERKIDGFNTKDGFQDLGDKGLLGYRNSDPTVGWFALGAGLELVTGAGVVLLGPFGNILQGVKFLVQAAVLAAAESVQYEVSANRRLETPSGDSQSTLMGPGKGDIYYGLWYPIIVALVTVVIGGLFVRETKDNDIYAAD
ncbi:MAG: hypothetical protein AAB037_00515, partial [Chloroflexota bacterium]